MTAEVAIRAATGADVTALAALWHAGWRDAHAAIVPPALTRLRTLVDLRERLERRLGDVFIAERDAAPVGLFLLTDDELEQFYVDAAARGGGVAQRLIQAAEAALAARGVDRAWLACAIGNERAARFYRKAGWTLARTEMDPLETPEGPFELAVWRFEKDLSDSGAGEDAKA